MLIWHWTLNVQVRKRMVFAFNAKAEFKTPLWFAIRFQKKDSLDVLIRYHDRARDLALASYVTSCALTQRKDCVPNVT